MFGSGMNLITTIIGFGMSATFIVFVCTRLICGRLRRMESRQMFEVGSRMEFELPEHRINGLEPTVVAAIPTMKFNREAFSSTEEDAQCAICLGEYQEKEVLRIMPKCGHSFHLSCIDVWLRKQSTCPVCRLSVQDSIQAKYVRQTDQVRTRASNNNSENNSVEHSQIWLLPSGERSEATGSVQTRSDSVAINLETSVPGEGAVR
ncbi:hypothetical protein M9H77_33304 [Catharanthus roseus]|uniref:Uncharacterized protein n=1 Tax=Catharanthus roseus TaxID=4058 RepID=A0ACB9ZI78_CATRO|nr:hypothetical protein M9H77_33304 [Catharanthus roseus]